MAEKISTLIIKVDLDCRQCYKKIRKILCKLQDQERIRTISYDDRSKMIAIAGPFDPHKLSCKIRCKGGKVVKGVQIMDDGGGGKPAKMAEPPPPPVNNGKQKGKGKPKQMPPAAEPPLPQPPAAAAMPLPAPPDPDREISALVPTIVEERKPRERPAELEPPPPPPPPPPHAARPVRPADVMTPTVEIPLWPAPPVGQPCRCACYQGYYEGCRCGRVYGYAVGVGPPPQLPTPAGCYGGAGEPYYGGYRGCQLFNEEDPASACTVM